MLKRLLENWLDNASERSYQPVFCQILVSQGYTIIHNTRHHPLELGKDIIAVSPEGVPCAFQLKGNPGGRVNLSQYRQEIAHQLKELAFLSLESLGIDKSHQCFFVTNGEVDEDVRRAISDLNATIKKQVGKERCIQIKARGEFLNEAISLEGNLWPKEITDLRLMLEIMSTKGNELFPCKKFDILLREVLCLKEGSKKPKINELKRNITSAGLLTAACLHTFAIEKNHYAAITAWTMYATYVVAVCERFGFNFDKIGKVSFGIACDSILTNLLLIFEEVQEKLPYLVEGDGRAEFAVYKYRYTLVVGLMSLLWLWPDSKRLLEKDNKFEKLENFLNEARDKIYLFGEGAVPQYLTYYFYLSSSKQATESKSLIFNLLSEILSRKSEENPYSLVDSYGTIDEVIVHEFSQTLESIDSPIIDYNFSLDSDFSKTLLSLMVRKNLKDECKKLWKKYSKIGFTQFIPKEPWNYCLIYSEMGNNKTELSKPRGEWKELEKEVNKNSKNSFPLILDTYPHILALFTVLFPYRAILDVVITLDGKYSEY